MRLNEKAPILTKAGWVNCHGDIILIVIQKWLLDGVRASIDECYPRVERVLGRVEGLLEMLPQPTEDDHLSYITVAELAEHIRIMLERLSALAT